MILHRLAAACVLVLIGASAAAEPPRKIQIRYDFTRQSPEALEVWVNCEDDETWETCPTKGQDDSKKKLRGPAASAFLLKATDRVLLVAIWKSAAETRGDIAYAVTGTNLDEKDLAAVKKIVSAGLLMGPEGAVRSNIRVEEKRGERPERRFDSKSVTDDLIAGGKLSVTFAVKTPAPDPSKETIVESAGPLAFRIAAEPPRLTVSTGIVLSNAPEPQVAIVKSSTILTFEKDGKTQQAYQQVITVRDDRTQFSPIQSLVALTNFRLVSRMYASMGFQLNQNLFQEPLAGVTYRHAIGKVGLNLTAALHFSREQQIVNESGFTDGYQIDPAMALTVDDIPTEMRYHVRYAFGMTLDFF